MRSAPVVPDQDSLHVRISRGFSSLPPAEKKVAFFLLQQGYQYPDLALADLATLAGVSNAVVVRMCQLLGFSGFRPFRLEWVKERARSAPRDQSIDPAFANVFAALNQTAELLSPEALDQAAEAILAARQFFIYASGGSSYVAQLAAAAFTAAGRLAITFNEAMWRMPNRAFADAETAILLITHRGFNSTMQEVVESDRSRGATIITLTSDPASDLGRIADIALVTGCPTGSDSRQLERSAARVVQLAAVHALVTATTGLARKPHRISARERIEGGRSHGAQPPV